MLGKELTLKKEIDFKLEYEEATGESASKLFKNWKRSRKHRYSDISKLFK